MPRIIITKRIMSKEIFSKGLSRLVERQDKKYFFFRENLKYELINHKLIGKSRYCEHIRTFQFRRNSIVIYDEIRFKRKFEFKEFFPVNYLFFNLKHTNDNIFELADKKAKVQLMFPDGCYVTDKNFYCARGNLKALRAKNIERIFHAGDIINLKIIAKFG